MNSDNEIVNDHNYNAIMPKRATPKKKHVTFGATPKVNKKKQVKFVNETCPELRGKCVVSRGGCKPAKLWNAYQITRSVDRSIKKIPYNKAESKRVYALVRDSLTPEKRETYACNTMRAYGKNVVRDFRNKLNTNQSIKSSTVQTCNQSFQHLWQMCRKQTMGKMSGNMRSMNDLPITSSQWLGIGRAVERVFLHGIFTKKLVRNITVQQVDQPQNASIPFTLRGNTLLINIACLKNLNPKSYLKSMFSRLGEKDDTVPTVVDVCLGIWAVVLTFMVASQSDNVTNRKDHLNEIKTVAACHFGIKLEPSMYKLHVST